MHCSLHKATSEIISSSIIIAAYTIIVNKRTLASFDNDYNIALLGLIG